MSPSYLRALILPFLSHAAAALYVPSQSIIPPFPVTALMASADGTTLAIVGTANPPGTPSVALYMPTPVEWALQQVIQGITLGAVSSDGGATLAALPSSAGTGPILYARTGRVWAQSQQLPAPWGASATISGVAFADPATLAVLISSPPTASLQTFTRDAGSIWTASAVFPVAAPISGSHLTASSTVLAWGATVPRSGSTQHTVAYASRDAHGAWTSPTSAFITARDGGQGDSFGLAVQISVDGHALVAASAGSACARASVSVFRSDPDWVLEAEIVPVDGVDGDPFTSSVTFSPDGLTLALGGTANASSVTCGAGAYAATRVYVYGRDAAGAWGLQQRVIGDVQAGQPTMCVSTIAFSGDSAALFIATTFANTSASPVLVFVSNASSSSEYDDGTPLGPVPNDDGAPVVHNEAPREQATAATFVEDQQVYTPCCCTLAISADGSTLVSGTTLGPWGPALNPCSSTFTRVQTSWVLDAVYGGVVAPTLADDGSVIAGINISSGGVTIISTSTGVSTQLVLPPCTVLGVDFMSPTSIAIATWLPAAPPCPNTGVLSVLVYLFVSASWVPGPIMNASDCFAAPTPNVPTAVTASLVAIAVGMSLPVQSASSPEGAVVTWSLDGASGYFVERLLTGSNGGVGDSFGASFAFSGDGASLAVAATGGAGSALACAPRATTYIFSVNEASPAEAWPQIAEIVPVDGSAADLMGASLAVSGDGGTLVASTSPAGASCAGQAYVFQRSVASTPSASWALAQRLFPDTSMAPCVASVAITPDASYAFVGTFNVSATPRGLTPIIIFAGAASTARAPVPSAARPSPTPIAFLAFERTQSLYAPCCCDLVTAGDGLTLLTSGIAPQCTAIYTRPPGSLSPANWTLQQVLPGVINAVLSFNGSVLVGALNPAVPPFVPPTIVVVYARTGLVYQPALQLPSEAVGSSIVGIGYVDHDTFAVATWTAAPPANASCTGGALALMLRTITASSWSPDVTLVTTDCPTMPPVSPITGVAPWNLATTAGVVAVNLATVVSSPVSGTQGVTYVYTRAADGSGWAQTKVTAADGGAGDAFGAAIAVSTDRTPRLIAGAPGGASSRGAAYIYAPNDAGLWEQTQRVTSADDLTGSLFSSAVAISAAGATLVVASGSTVRVNCSAQVYAFAFNQAPGAPTAWLERQIVTTYADGICVSDVAVTPDGATIFVAALNAGTGAASGPIAVYASRRA